MPHTVKHTITAAQVRKGDLLSTADPDMVVTAIDRKVSWTTLTLADGSRPMRVRVDDEIVVFRVEPTDDEKAAQKHDYMIHQMRDVLMTMLKKSPSAVLTELITKYGDNVELLTWSNLPDVLKAQARYKHAVEIRATIHHLGDQRGRLIDINEPKDVLNVDADILFDAFAWWMNKVARTDEYGPHDPFSRSTNVISNLLEDTDTWAVGDIIKQLTWSGAARTVLMARAAELVAEAQAKNAAKQ